MKKFLVFLTGLFLVASFSMAQGPDKTRIISDEQEPKANLPTETSTEPAAYINYLEGDIFFQNLEKVAIGMVLLQGDELIATKGRVEVYLRNGDFLRLDRNTRVAFITLEGRTVLGIWSGSIYVRATEEIQVKTPHQEFLLQNGLYRIDVEATTAIYQNPRIVDSFDSWNHKRENELNYSTAEIRPLPYGWYPYYNWRWYLYGCYGWHPFFWHSYYHYHYFFNFYHYRHYDSHWQYPQRSMIHVHRNQLQVPPHRILNTPQTVNRSTISPRSLFRANTQFRPSPSPKISSRSSRSSLSPSRSFSRPMSLQKSIIKSSIRKK